MTLRVQLFHFTVKNVTCGLKNINVLIHDAEVIQAPVIHKVTVQASDNVFFKVEGW